MLSSENGRAPPGTALPVDNYWPWW